MKASIHIKQLVFKNGTTLDLKSNSIVVFVGPNNAGKSRTLKEINDLTKTNNVNPLILERISFHQQGTADEFIKRIEPMKKNGYYHITAGPGSIQSDSESSLTAAWISYNRPLGEYNKLKVNLYMVKHLSTSERLTLVEPPKNINFLKDVLTHPIHHLKADDQKEKLFSENFKRAFGEDIVVNHGAGSIVPLHVGTKPVSTVEHDRISTKYQEELVKLGMLHDQGDGMKSFAGVFLGLFVEDNSINLIDEPEAFLHPPQAGLLGQMIAKNIGDDKQIFIATHSEELLKGLLDNTGDRLLIVRIQRIGSSNTTSVLSNTEIKTIWKDSLLRHSNILSGLFHSKVVLCESDSDNRFYSAISTVLSENKKLVAKDILFVQSGGKHRFPVVIKALKKLEVPLVVIGDFDLYNKEEPIKTIFEDMGGNWDEIKTYFKIVKQSIDQKKPELETADLKASIEEIFNNTTTKIMPEHAIKLIEKELKKSSPWGQAKSSGTAYLPAGDATSSFFKMQTELQSKQIFILENGELEAFDKTIGGHGPKWVNEVLAKDLISAPELQSARDFVEQAILI